MPDNNSRLHNIPNLSGSDVDNNLLHQVNFNYYSTSSFCCSESLIQSVSNCSSFSVLHANHDKLISLLSDLTHNSHLLGISETEMMVDKDPVANVNISGYNFISQPSYQNTGGVGFYIRSDCEYQLGITSVLLQQILNVFGLKSMLSLVEI